MDPKELIVYGNYHEDTYLIVRSDKPNNPRELLVVHQDYFHQEAAILFKIDFDGDWSESMLLDSAKRVVDHLNKTKFYPDSSE